MDDLLKVFAEAPSKAIRALLTTAILALAFLSKRVRQAVFYKRHDFELPSSSASSGVEWDIQWENLRVTLDVAKVHNDHLEGLKVKTNDVNPGITLSTMKVGEAYVQVPGPRGGSLRLAASFGQNRTGRESM